MQLHDAREVTEVSDPDDATKLIADGWRLIAVVSGHRWESGQQVIGPVYVLAKR